MCGIVGRIDFTGQPVDRALIKRMTTAIAHRGPDGEGVHVSGPVGLGHRRLAIIDLEGGAQPMSTPDSQVWVTFNGEIYNFKELRAQLESHGHEFRTQSDTEVLLHGWRQWGSGLVPRLRGMFAFCVADFVQKKWLLARDPFGIKPLTYRLEKSGIEFASELHALKRAGDVGRIEAIEWFLRYQYIPAPFTIYRDVMKLPPAHYIEGDFDGGVSEPKRYWRMDFKEEKGVSDDEWVERVNAALAESVEAHLIADVPVGLLLSGGVDSTLVAREMAKRGCKVTAFTMDFDVEGHGELEYAQQAAKRYGIELIHDTQTDDFWDELPELVRHYGEPFGDNSMIPTWRVTKLAREHVPVVLGGDGGDEAFGGYRRYADWLKRPQTGKRRRRLREKPTMQHFRSLMWAHMRRMGFEKNSVFDWELLIEQTPLTSDRTSATRQGLWRNEFQELATQASSAFTTAGKLIGGTSPLDFAQEMDFETYLPGLILPKSDVASMYHGLEVRTPFLDYRTLELCAGLPANQRARVNADDQHLKILLRRSLKKDFSDDFVHRRKKGFGSPLKAWFAPGARGLAFAREAILDESAGLEDWFDMKLVTELVEKPGGDYDNSAVLWLLLVLALWRRDNAQMSFA